MNGNYIMPGYREPAGEFSFSVSGYFVLAAIHGRFMQTRC